MKTNSLLHASMMTVMLSLIVFSCDQEVMMQKRDTPTNAEVLTETNKITPDGITKLDESEKITVELPITKEMEDAVVEVVKPVKDVVEKLLNEDKSGTYEAYKKDVERLITLKEDKEKELFVDQIKEKYFPFFNEIWKKADIDDEMYQQKIKNIFPEDIQETIEFKEFLTFSVHKKKPTRDHEPHPLPPAPPASENICFKPQSAWFAVTHTEHSALSITSAFATDINVATSTLASEAGYSNATAGMVSNITIPGTFPDDDKVLRVKKTFKWSGNALAISILGCSFASMQYSSVMMEEFYRVWAPVTWLGVKTLDEDRAEEYIILKKFLYNIRYGVSTYSDSYAGFLASSTSSSMCYRMKWDVCEEQPN